MKRADANDILRERGAAELRATFDRDSVPYRPAVNGIRHVEPATDDRADQQPRRLKAVADLTLRTGSDYLLKGWVYRGDFVTIFGAAGCGKSLFAADLFYRLAQGEDRIYGKRARKAVALFVCLEGQRGFEQRLIALRERRGPAPDFHLDNSAPFALASDADVDALAATARRVGADVLILDTWSQATAGCDEGSSADVGRALAAVNRLRLETGAAVVVLDHVGWAADGEAARRTRGWSGKWAAFDVALYLDGDIKSGDVSVVPRRLKDGVDFAAVTFGSTRVDLGADDDGDPIVAFVAVERPAGASKPIATERAPRTRGERAFLAAFDEAVGAHGRTHPVMGDGPLVRAVPVATVRDAFRRHYATGEGDPAKQADASRKAFVRALNASGAAFPTETTPAGEELVWRIAKTPANPGRTDRT